MAFTLSHKFLSNVLEESRLGLSQVRDESGNITFYEIVHKQKKGLIRYDKTFALQVERWAAQYKRCKILWDLSEIENDQQNWEFKEGFTETMRAEPTRCELAPGSAFELAQCEKFDPLANDGEGSTENVMPSYTNKGYAYQVRLNRLSRPAAWKAEALALGFQVKNGENGKFFYGSSFPGGELNYTPPLGFLTKFKLKGGPVSRPDGGSSDKPPAPRREVKDSKGRVKSSKARPSGGAECQPPTGSLGASSKRSSARSAADGIRSRRAEEAAAVAKIWIPIPAYDSTRELGKAFRSKSSAVQAATLIKTQTPRMKKLAARGDSKYCKDLLAVLKRKVEDWDPEAAGGQLRMPLKTLMQTVAKRAPSEALYCRMISLLNGSFFINWVTYDVMTTDQRTEINLANAFSTDEEEDDDNDSDGDDDEDNEGEPGRAPQARAESEDEFNSPNSGSDSSDESDSD